MLSSVAVYPIFPSSRNAVLIDATRFNIKQYFLGQQAFISVADAASDAWQYLAHILLPNAGIDLAKRVPNRASKKGRR